MFAESANFPSLSVPTYVSLTISCVDTSQIFTKSFVESQKSKAKSWLAQTAAEMGLDLDEQLQEEEQAGETDVRHIKALQNDKKRLRELLNADSGTTMSNHSGRGSKKQKPAPYSSSSRRSPFVVVAR